MTETMGDNIKFGFALLLLAAGVVGFYMLSEQAMIVRVLCIFAGIGVSAAVARLTAPGQQFIDFARDSITETRKVSFVEVMYVFWLIQQIAKLRRMMY